VVDPSSVSFVVDPSSVSFVVDPSSVSLLLTSYCDVRSLFSVCSTPSACPPDASTPGDIMDVSMRKAKTVAKS
jgi:hypothetical protein